MIEFLCLIVGIVAILFIVGYVTTPQTKKQEPLGKYDKPRVYKKRTKEIYYQKDMVDIGRTQVRLVFDDGKKFSVYVYGEFNQQPFYGRDEHDEWLLEEPSVWDKSLSSRICAQKIISRNDLDGTYTNDPKNVTESYNGKVVSAKILNDESYVIKCDVYKVRDIK